MTFKIIDKFEQFQIQNDQLRQFYVKGSVQPAEQSIGSPSMEMYDTRSVSTPMDQGAFWIEVYEDETSTTQVAWAQFGFCKDTAICSNVSVEMEYRRRGIATAMYDLTEDLFGKPILPARVLSCDAKAFWKYRE